MSKSELIYKDVAPGADEDCAFSAPGAISASDLPALSGGVETGKIATLEKNRWMLDGTFVLFENQKIAFWSDNMSGGDGTFENVPEITVDFGKQYSSVGVTLAFDTATGEYCSLVSVKWYRDGTMIAEQDFTPDSAVYFCQKNVENFDSLVISLKKTSLPGRRAKVNHIIFGVHRNFGMTELKDVTISNQTDISSITLPISSMKWTLDCRSDIDFMFQLKQPVEALNDGNLIGVFYIDQFKRSSDSLYSVDCVDAIGVLDDSIFQGGVYSEKSANELLAEIVDGQFDIVLEVEDTNLTGILTRSSAREAMQQVLFAWGVCASTDGRNSIRVFQAGDVPAVIGKSRTYTGATVSQSAIVTEVQVTAHTYAEDANGNVEVLGKKYSDTKAVYSVSNQYVKPTDKKNVVSISKATLISPGIAEAVAQRVFDYYEKRNTVKSTFVWNGERLGDCVTQPTPWETTATGNLQKMTIKLSNTVAVQSESVGV